MVKFRHSPADAINFYDIKRILVIKLRHHGDVLLTSPVFHVLKNHYPHIEIDALVYQETQDMLSLHPDIDQLHTIDKRLKTFGLKDRITEELRLLNKLKARNYDLMIHFTENRRGIVIKHYCGIPIVVAGQYRRRKGFLWRRTFTHLYSIFPSGRRHRVEQHLDALRRLGLQPDEAERQLILTVGEDARKKVIELLGAKGVASGGYVHIHPTTRWLFKSWSSEKVAQIIDRLARKGKKVVLTSSPDKQEMLMIDDILDKTESNPVNLCGLLSLKELAAVIELADVFFGMDSVPMHMAAALDTPLVALFGPSSLVDWAPWCKNKIILTSDSFPCMPCNLDGCGGGKLSECLMVLSVDQVMTALEKITRRPKLAN